MATVKVRPRPAHTQGITRCAYTPDGTKLVTVGSNNTIRLYETGFDGEPVNVDDCPEQNVAVAATNDIFIVGSEDGTVSVYSLETHAFERFLLRCSLPVRDVALSPDGQWCAVASDELTVKLVNVADMTRLHLLAEHSRPTKHLSFDPGRSLLALACTDGVIYLYSLTADAPELIRKVDAVIGALETDAEPSAAIAWHPDGRAFAVPTPTHEIQVVSKNDWEKQRVFSSSRGHEGDITALAWSPNGALLASAGKDNKILIWLVKDQSVVARFTQANAMDIAWHPTTNLVSFTTSDGEVYICQDFIPSRLASTLTLRLQPAPFIHDPLAEISNQPGGGDAGRRHGLPVRPRRDPLYGDDDNKGDEDGDNLFVGDEDDDFIVDDDGAGYALNSGRKRAANDSDSLGHRPSKRAHLPLRYLQPQQRYYHEAFQPGATSWRGNRKYLCLNFIGFVWTVDQDSHNTVTVEFYDHDFHRNFHFTDTFLYDKACLNDQGTLFSCPPRLGGRATIFYRPHETWTQRNDWHTGLPYGEAVLAMSLSDSFITITTTGNYVRIYTLFGIPYRVYRPKSSPMVTCASWRDYVMTVGNGPIGPNGSTRLLYSIENVKRDEICQNEDTVALPEGATLESVFFSDKGDPCIYDSTGTLLALLHWRRPSRASWIPLLDTKLLPRLASGCKDETYYPIAVANNKFHCIILKGGDRYPYFPRPLLSEFDFSVPLTSLPKHKKKTKNGRKSKTNDNSDDDILTDADDVADGDGDEDQEEDESDADAADNPASELYRLTQTFLLKGLEAAQLTDIVDATTTGRGTASQRVLLARLALDIDKTLLQLLAMECREGEERGMRALELVRLMRDRSGRMMDAAGKVAERYGCRILGEKIRGLGERRLAGEEDDDDGDGDEDEGDGEG